MEYTLIRAKRKTISIAIKPDGTVEVRCPVRMPKRDVDLFVTRHTDWITRHRAVVEERNGRRARFDFSDGQSFYFLGQAYPIVSGTGAKAALTHNALALPGDGDRDSRESAALVFLREQARQYIPPMVREWADKTNLHPASVKITSARTRWGSCSGQNRVCFSLRLMSLPPELITYVVVHELCHLAQHNHSGAFYALIRQHLPDYKERMAGIKDFHAFILF